MKVLVTGAAGFIGFHVVQALLKKSIEVVGIDNLNEYYDVNLKIARLEECGVIVRADGMVIKQPDNGNYRFMFLNIADKAGLDRLFAEEKFTHVINLAAQAGVRYSLDNPYAYLESNLAGFLNILEAVRNNPVEHLVYASSSSVYGLNGKIPFSAEDRVDEPISLYAATKRSNELMAHTYSHLFNIPSTGLRFFTVYGPWGRPDMAYFKFAQKILNGESIEVYNNGDLKRDFTYIDDIVNGIIKILAKAPTKNGDHAAAKVYNIGNNQPVQLLEFIKILETNLGRTAEKKFLPMQPGDVYATWADIDPLINEINYKPLTNIDTGLQKFVEWFKSYYKV